MGKPVPGTGATRKGLYSAGFVNPDPANWTFAPPVKVPRLSGGNMEAGGREVVYRSAEKTRLVCHVCSSPLSDPLTLVLSLLVSCIRHYCTTACDGTVTLCTPVGRPVLIVPLGGHGVKRHILTALSGIPLGLLCFTL